MMSMLDETKTKVNIFVLDWKYAVDTPPERKRRNSTLNSLESGSDDGEIDKMHKSEKVRPHEDKLNEASGKTKF